MDIVVINSKEVRVSYAGLDIGVFDDEGNARQAASEIEPILQSRNAKMLDMAITIIQKHGGQYGQGKKS